MNRKQQITAESSRLLKGGCIRGGVKVWHVMEIILFELLESSAVRVSDSETGLKFLEVGYRIPDK